MLVTHHCCARGPQMGTYFSYFAIKGTWMGKDEPCHSKDIRNMSPGPGVALCNLFQAHPADRSASNMQAFTWGTGVRGGCAEPSGRFQMLPRVGVLTPLMSLTVEQDTNPLLSLAPRPLKVGRLQSVLGKQGRRQQWTQARAGLPLL